MATKEDEKIKAEAERKRVEALMEKYFQEQAAKSPDLTFEDISTVPDLPQKKLFIPEWGGNVTIRALTQLEISNIRDAATEGDTVVPPLLQRGILQAAFVRPVLSPERADALLQKRASVVNSILAEIDKLNGRDVTVEEIEGHFRNEPGTVEPVLPGGDAAQDGGRDADGSPAAS